jgi:hypothetical protein
MPKYYEHSAPKRRKLERQLDLEDAHGELILNTKEYQHSRNDNF